MKILHISDLHIGKRVHGFSMIEDQKYILNQVLNVIDEQKIDIVLIAGDVYDQSIPSEQAIEVLDSFLDALVSRQLLVCMISGNHDSYVRLGFGSNVFQKQNVWIVSGYHGEVMYVDYKNVRIHMLPFIKPAMVQPFFEEKIDSYQKAMECALSTACLDESRLNVLMAHQFIVGSSTCDSEEVSVGGLDQISADVFSAFDYVALGHLHSFQKAGRNGYYCGTLLKYSVDEILQKKKMIVLDVNDSIQIQEVDLHPLRDLAEIKGTYMDLTSASFYCGLHREDYYSIVLTDENDVPNAFSKLQVIYPNAMCLTYENERTKEQAQVKAIQNIEQKDPLVLISDFYKLQNNLDMNDEQKEIVQAIWEEIV